MRTLLSAIFFVHGLVHVVGFIGPLEMIANAPFQTMVLGQPVPNQSLTARAFGVLWLLLALAFSVASVAVYIEADWWLAYTTVLVLASSVLCLVAWPASSAGLLVNAVLLALLVVANRAQLWVHLIALFRSWPN